MIELKFGQYQPIDAEDVKARRKAEEQYRNQKAYSEAQKADLLKKQRKILSVRIRSCAWIAMQSVA